MPNISQLAGEPVNGPVGRFSQSSAISSRPPVIHPDDEPDISQSDCRLERLNGARSGRRYPAMHRPAPGLTAARYGARAGTDRMTPPAVFSAASDHGAPSAGGEGARRRRAGRCHYGYRKRSTSG